MLPVPGRHPLLSDGLAWLDCQIQTVHPAGDRDIVIARALS
ncbi:flavin reductase family protein [Streptomyces fulvoviolaceus]|nr:flavin reductase family protein [Streptomyces fulvoviolaceus]